MKCNHDPYWISCFGNCMACRAVNAEAECKELREQVAKLRAALARIASDEPFIVQCGGGIDVTASMQAVNRANYERIAKLIAAEVLAETTPKEPAK